VSTSHRILLKSETSGDYVDAQLIERIDSSYAWAVDDIWQEYIAVAQSEAQKNGSPDAFSEHGHWNWHAKVSASSHLLSCPTLAVECDGQTQGLMLLITDGHFSYLPAQIGKPLVYVSYLATAPWNLPAVTASTVYRGVGTVLIRAAILTSLDLGFKGRVGLHSLPQSEKFYDCHGFVCMGNDAEKQNLKYYELSPEGAAEFLK